MDKYRGRGAHRAGLFHRDRAVQFQLPLRRHRRRHFRFGEFGRKLVARQRRPGQRPSAGTLLGAKLSIRRDARARRLSHRARPAHGRCLPSGRHRLQRLQVHLHRLGHRRASVGLSVAIQWQQHFGRDRRDVHDPQRATDQRRPLPCPRQQRRRHRHQFGFAADNYLLATVSDANPGGRPGCVLAVERNQRPDRLRFGWHQRRNHRRDRCAGCKGRYCAGIPGL